MAGQSFAMFGWSWTEACVLGSQVFGRALMESCAQDERPYDKKHTVCLGFSFKSAPTV